MDSDQWSDPKWFRSIVLIPVVSDSDLLPHPNINLIRTILRHVISNKWKINISFEISSQKVPFYAEDEE